MCLRLAALIMPLAVWKPLAMQNSTILLLAALVIISSGCISSDGPSSHNSGQAAVNLTRNCPDTIKGVWLSANTHLGEILTEDSGRLRELGVNTIGFGIGCVINEDGTCFYRGEDQLISNIVRAKQQGFAVLLTTDFLGANPGSFEEQGVRITEEQYLAVSEEAALYWARIAEKYNVEFFAPQSALDGMMEMNFAENQSDAGTKASEWHRGMLPKLRERFSGRVIAKIGQISEVYDMTGYDYMGLTITPTHGWDLKDFREYVRTEYSMLARVAHKSGSKWYLSEVWMPYGGLPGMEAVDARLRSKYGQSLDELQDDYYRITIEEYLNMTENGPSGYVFHPWDGAGAGVKDRPAEDVIKEFFGRI